MNNCYSAEQAAMEKASSFSRKFLSLQENVGRKVIREIWGVATPECPGPQGSQVRRHHLCPVHYCSLALGLQALNLFCSCLLPGLPVPHLQLLCPFGTARSPRVPRDCQGTGAPAELLRFSWVPIPAPWREGRNICSNTHGQLG